MKYFVIGASGLVGSNFLTHLKEEGHQALGTHLSLPTDKTVYFNSLNLNDPENYNLDQFKPEVIVHCVALAHVDRAEEEVEESHDLTVKTTINAIELAKKYNAKLVFTSTDYVFDGKNGTYKESDEVNPLSVYGKHKLEAEQYIQKELPNDGIILRIGSVYGDEIRGKNFIIRIVNDVLNGREWSMTLPQDQYSTPVWAYDVARVAVMLAEDHKSGIYHVGSTDFMNRIQLAKKVLDYYPQHKCTVNGILTKELGQKAARPLIGGFVSAKLLNEYPDFQFHNVDDYLKTKQ